MKMKLILIEKRVEIWTSRNNFLEGVSLLKIQDQCTVKKLYMNQNTRLLLDLVFNCSKFNAKNLKSYQVVDQGIPQFLPLQLTLTNAEISLKYIAELIKESSKEKNAWNKTEKKEIHKNWRGLLLRYRNSQFMMRNLGIARFGSIIKKRKVGGMIWNKHWRIIAR